MTSLTAYVTYVNLFIVYHENEGEAIPFLLYFDKTNVIPPQKEGKMHKKSQYNAKNILHFNRD